MAELVVRWGDENLKRFGNAIAELNATFPKVLPRIINQVGDRAKTQVIRNLTAQTGLPRRTIVKAIAKGPVRRAHEGKLSYEMTASGGDVRLKFFAPRETRAGVSAKPWGTRQVFAGTFMRGGWWPHRVTTPKLKGDVWRNNGYGMRRDGRFGTRITFAKSGLFIAEEMVKGATAAAFEGTTVPLLQQRVEAALNKLLR